MQSRRTHRGVSQRWSMKWKRIHKRKQKYLYKGLSALVEWGLQVVQTFVCSRSALYRVKGGCTDYDTPKEEKIEKEKDASLVLWVLYSQQTNGSNVPTYLWYLMKKKTSNNYKITITKKKFENLFRSSNFITMINQLSR